MPTTNDSPRFPKPTMTTFRVATSRPGETEQWGDLGGQINFRSACFRRCHLTGLGDEVWSLQLWAVGTIE